MTLNIVFVYYISSVTSVKFLQYETLNVEKYLQATWYIYFSGYILLLLVYLLFLVTSEFGINLDFIPLIQFVFFSFKILLYSFLFPGKTSFLLLFPSIYCYF